MTSTRFLLNTLLAVAASWTSLTHAQCAPDALGTARTVTLKREFAAYGKQQHDAFALQKGEVILTFDDGPRTETTPLVLQALADQCVKATFFMVGDKLAQDPGLARRAVAQGHSAGIHSYTHTNMSTLAEAEQLADLKATQAAYHAVFGTDAPAYRFPYLAEAPATLAALKASKVMVFSIDLGINDWLPEDTDAILAKRLADGLDANGSGIILMHDANSPTAHALPVLLKVLKDKGYRVVHLEWEGQ